MVRTMPQKDSGLFGNLFDLNGDGKTDASEAAFMFMIFDEMQKEDDRQRQACVPKIRDLDEINIDETTVDLDDLDIPGI